MTAATGAVVMEETPKLEAKSPFLKRQVGKLDEGDLLQMKDGSLVQIYYHNGSDYMSFKDWPSCSGLSATTSNIEGTLYDALTLEEAWRRWRQRQETAVLAAQRGWTMEQQAIMESQVREAVRSSALKHIASMPKTMEHQVTAGWWVLSLRIKPVVDDSKLVKLLSQRKDVASHVACTDGVMRSSEKNLFAWLLEKEDWLAHARKVFPDFVAVVDMEEPYNGESMLIRAELVMSPDFFKHLHSVHT
jgi:hypothetical protein